MVAYIFFGLKFVEHSGVVLAAVTFKCRSKMHNLKKKVKTFFKVLVDVVFALFSSTFSSFALNVYPCITFSFSENYDRIPYL